MRLVAPDNMTGKPYRSHCFFQAEDGIRDDLVTGVQTCALRSVKTRRQQLKTKIAEVIRGGCSNTPGALLDCLHLCADDYCARYVGDSALDGAGRGGLGKKIPAAAGDHERHGDRKSVV